jgi:hypothetical protein
VDESGRTAEPGLYVLAAVVVHAEQAEDVREVLRSGRRHQHRPFHWRMEEHDDQEAMAKLVGTIDLVSVVAVATPVDKHRTERARRLCMTQLLWELLRRNVTDVLFESRRPAQDREDQAHILHATQAQHLEPGLVYAFDHARNEPLLWLPDLVAGAVNRARFDAHDCCLQLLGPGVRVLEVGDSR